MRTILRFVVVLCLAVTSCVPELEAAPGQDDLEERIVGDGEPPYCLGRELGITLYEVLAEFLDAWCAWRSPADGWPPGFCLPYVLGNWCPTEYTCSTIMCGEDLYVTHPACVVEVSIAGDSSQWCLDFYSARRLL